MVIFRALKNPFLKDPCFLSFVSQRGKPIPFALISANAAGKKSV
jgi:hypothetical protein